MATTGRQGPAARAQRAIAEAVGEALASLDRVTEALCVAAGVCGNEVLGMRAYDDHYVLVVADGRKLRVPRETIKEYLTCAAAAAATAEDRP